MLHVVSRPTEPFRSASGAFEVHQVPAAQDNLIWLLVCTRTGEVAAVDGPSATELLAYMEPRNLQLRQVLNTHTHGDHIGLNRDLERRDLLAGLEVTGPALVVQAVPGITRAVDEGDEVQVGACRGRVLRTEGHLQGHVCYLFENVLFCGDTLFTGGCGRVFTQDFGAMFRSLERLSQLPPQTRVCCAHEYTEDNLAFAQSLEPKNQALRERVRKVKALRRDGHSTVPSTIAEELATNPMLRWESSELLRNLREQAPFAELSSHEAVFTAARKLKDGGAYKQRFAVAR